ncbi:MAG: TerB family tellurite resistance protein, partial [Alphaproteobacteria bacterium]|nr:TerB family tellurite resistance protein [Alphaproteobacteria bacterium]
LFALDRRKCRKLLSRAMAARLRDPSVFNSAMLLKRWASPELNDKLLAAATQVAHADGVLHDYEADLLQRLQRMLAPKTLAS